MMKTLLALIILVTVFGCSDKEKREKALRDLDRSQQTLVEVKDQITSFQEQLNKTVVELEVYKDDLNQVKQFQLMRTESDREKQIRQATQNILTAKENIEILNSNIKILTDSVFRTEMQISRLQNYLKN
jgi:hypothetical protein